MAGKEDKASQYFVNEAIKHLNGQKLEVKKLSTPDDFRSAIDPGLPSGIYGDKEGYKNPIGGWAESGRALEVGLTRVRQLGGTVRAGADVMGLLKDGRRVRGVTLRSGEEVLGDLVVVSLIHKSEFTVDGSRPLVERGRRDSLLRPALPAGYRLWWHRGTRSQQSSSLPKKWNSIRIHLS